MDNAGKLYLNDKSVGAVFRSGHSTAWNYGLFDPEEGFAEFAPLFACWSSLMHASDQESEMDQQTLAELRVAGVRYRRDPGQDLPGPSGKHGPASTSSTSTAD